MHELSICQQMLRQVRQVAVDNRAARVTCIRVAAGPLSGIEPRLLAQAFSIAKAGTLARDALLEIERTPLVVCCRSCGAESQVPANRLLCGQCNDWRVDVRQGEDLVLLSVELDGLADDSAEPQKSGLEGIESHV